MARFKGWIGSVLLVALGISQGFADDPAARKYSIAVDSELNMTVARTKQVVKVKATASFDYALIPLQGNQVETRIDGMELTTTLNDLPPNKTRMSRSGFFNSDGKETQDVKFETAPANLKTILEQFGQPLASYTLGSEGEESQPPVLKIKSGLLIQTNAFALARTFHVRFPKDSAKWVVASSLPLGQGQFSKGDLTFEKFAKPDAAGLVRVKVSGELKVNGKLGQAQINKGLYKVKGEQVYSLKVGDWVSGRYDIDMDIEADDPRTGLLSGKGPVSLILKTRP